MRSVLHGRLVKVPAKEKLVSASQTMPDGAVFGFLVD